MAFLCFLHCFLEPLSNLCTFTYISTLSVQLSLSTSCTSFSKSNRSFCCLPLLTSTFRLPFPFHAATASGACTLKAPSVCLLVSRPSDAASASLHVLCGCYNEPFHTGVAITNCASHVMRLSRLPEHHHTAAMMQFLDLLQCVWVLWCVTLPLLFR